jgi:hypothetical protein
MARWEKLRAEGKWFWIFKRGAVWLTLVLLLYGLGALFFPTLFNFQKIQLYILLGMFGGFMISSILEWSKMETAYQQIKRSK